MALTKKQESIGLRISAENKELIRYAADCMGQDITSYMVSTALEKAKKDIVEFNEVQTLVLSRRDYNKVEQELVSPSATNERLKSAFRNHSKKFEE